MEGRRGLAIEGNIGRYSGGQIDEFIMILRNKLLWRSKAVEANIILVSYLEKATKRAVHEEADVASSM